MRQIKDEFRVDPHEAIGTKAIEAPVFSAAQEQ
jgi:hypothetical protein